MHVDLRIFTVLFSRDRNLFLRIFLRVLREEIFQIYPEVIIKIGEGNLSLLLIHHQNYETTPNYILSSRIKYFLRNGNFTDYIANSDGSLILSGDHYYYHQISTQNITFYFISKYSIDK